MKILVYIRVFLVFFIFFGIMKGRRANVAQLFRALPCQGRGRELESLHSHHFRSRIYISCAIMVI